MTKQKTEPLIDILLAVYNAEKYLDVLLQSLINQDYKNIHIHVRDNCSTDRTLEILQKWKERYSERFTIHASKTNVGVVGNFAALLECSTAPYAAFCDGDDFWLPNKISLTFAQMQALEELHGKSTPLLVHTDLVVVDENLQTISPSFWNYSRLNTHPRCEKLPCLLVQNHVTGCTMMVNRPLMQLAMPIPDDCVMHDWWLSLVAASFGKIAHVPQSTLLYRQHSSNDTGAKPYGLWSYFRYKYKRRKPLKEKKLAQATLLKERYQAHLPESAKKTLEAYFKMQTAPLLLRPLHMLRHGFLKSGFLRNFSEL